MQVVEVVLADLRSKLISFVKDNKLRNTGQMTVSQPQNLHRHSR